MDADERERSVVRRLRQAIALVIVLGALAIALGYLDVTVTDLDYRDHVERAGSDVLSIFVLVLIAPAAWVLRRPRWPQLVVWIMWLTSWVMLGAIFALPGGSSEMVMPFWIRPLITASLAAIAGIVCIVLPLIRGAHKSPPLPRDTKLPPARVVR